MSVRRKLREELVSLLLAMTVATQKQDFKRVCAWRCVISIKGFHADQLKDLQVCLHLR